MAFRLSIQQQKARADHATALSNAWQEVQEKIDEANGIIANLMAEINVAIDAYNAARDAAQSWVDDQRTAWREEYDNKSEKWQEGDRASEVDSFISEWENLDLEEVEHIGAPDLELSGDGQDHIDTLEGLPDNSE